VVASLVVAGLMSPWIYQGGKYLGERALAGEVTGILKWLGDAAWRSEFPRFFNRALMLAALLLLPVLFRRIRVLRREAGSLPLIDSPTKLPWKRRLMLGLAGFVIAAGMLWILGISLEFAGAFEPRDSAPGFGKFVRKAVLPAVGASLLEEWLFRGLLLGLWLRFARPLAACVGCSLLFAFVHFLEPPDGVTLANPAAADAGFRLIGQILWNFTDPRFFTGDFLTLFVVGLILAFTKIRTGSLAFPIGLHAGWIIAFKGFNLLYDDTVGSALRPWGVGDSLRSGLLPLLTLALTGLLCHLVLRSSGAIRKFSGPL
jgi:membrane protease YdiL (CAAX protease family)